MIFSVCFLCQTDLKKTLKSHNRVGIFVGQYSSKAQEQIVPVREFFFTNALITFARFCLFVCF